VGFTTDKASEFWDSLPDRTKVGEQGKIYQELSTGDATTSVWGVKNSVVSPTPKIGVDENSSRGGNEKLNELGVSISWERGSLEEEEELDILFEREEKD